MRRGLSCPQKTVQLRARGVTSCLTWVADPAADATGIALHFGSVQPGSKAPGTVTFKNACGLDIELAGLRTSDPVFAVTAANPNDATTLLVPKATRDANMVWTDGTAVATLEFRPTALGPKQGQFNADSSLASQSLVSVLIKGFGGGPKIDVRPSPVFSIGRVGFTPGASPGSSAQRTLRVSNVGNRPTPPDPRANLYLGVDGQGTNYFSVRAITGSIDELCVGEWDLAANDCAGTLSPGQYDPTVGLEAVAGQALHLPVRVIPSSAGPKEWELTIFSNDTSSPATVVRITAEAVAAPPCNYSVTPTNLNFGVMDVPQMKELTFTLRNLGTTPTEICFFNGLGLSPQSNAMYSLVGAPTDFELAPSTNQVVTVRAAPTMSPTAPTMVPGAVLFNVSTPGASQGVVMLQTTLAPSCISVTPNPANFTDTELACGSPDRAITITNNCSTSVTLNTTVLTNTASAPNGTGGCTGTGCQQFVVTSAPTAGPIAAGASRVALVRFRPYVLGPIQGELTMTLQQGSNVMPYAVPLNGNGRARTSANCGVSAVCPGPITTNANSTVTLTPSVMSGGAATCQWSVGSRPATSSGTFSTPTSCTSTRYFADVVGTHVVDFTVSDGLGSTSQCSVPITVNPNGDLWIELT
ncbi:MAG TPA: choice-of-anchor D domain-containing protein, partial [Archangium sp.]